MVHILGPWAQSWLLPWWCLEPIWKSSRDLKLGKWHHDCIVNHETELTEWSHPLHGIVAIIAKTVLVKTVAGLSNIRLAWLPQVGHRAQTYRVGTNLNIEQGLKVRKMASWWLHYKPQNGTDLELPTSKQCCDHCEDSCLLPVGMEVSVCKWQCSITIWQVDRFCHCWKPLTVSPRAMMTYRLAIRSQHSSSMWFYSKWQCQMHLIVMWRHWCPSFTCGQCLTTA